MVNETFVLELEVNKEEENYMKTFFAVFLGILAAVAVIAGFASWRSKVARMDQADKLIRSSLEVAATCRSADPNTLALIRSNLERAEEAISAAEGWDEYSPEHIMKKEALHNRFVAAGCFRN